ncbi:MAG: hypothetical protein ACTSQO_01025 [Candidatus Helarchaeota archaeon]
MFKTSRKIYFLFLILLFLLGMVWPFYSINQSSKLLNKEKISTASSARDYLGLYSFTNDTVGSDPVGWVETEPGVSDFHIISEKDGHRNVYQLKSDLLSGTFSHAINSFSSRSSGTIEFWEMDDGQGEGNLYLGITESSYYIGEVITDNGAFKWYYNDGSWKKIVLQTYIPNTWYHVRIDFECSNGKYKGLTEDTASVYINNKKVGDSLPLSNHGTPPNFVDGFEISLGYTTPAMYKWVDAIDYSWAIGYYLGRNTIYADPSAKNYKGLYSFTDDINGAPPDNWTVYSGTLQVIDSKNDHRKVLEFVDNSTIYNVFAPQESGIIELWAYPTSINSHLCFALAYADFGRYDFSIYVAFHSNGYLVYYYNNGYSYKNIVSYTPNKWYHLKFVFNCSLGTYDIYLDKVLVKANAPFRSSGLSKMDRLRIHFKGETSGPYIDAIDYSWAKLYYEGRNYYIIPPSYDYLGLYSFTNDTIGSDPVNWTENEAGVADFHIISELEGHKNVYQLKSDLLLGTFSSSINSFSNRPSGSIEFWIMDDGNGNGNIYLGIVESSKYIGELITDNGAFKWYYNDGSWKKIFLQNYTANIWYHIRIDFECSTGKYKGLMEDTAAIYINNIKISDTLPLFNRGTPPTFVNGFKISIGYTTPEMFKWIDAIDYSWAPGYYEGRNYNTTKGNLIFAPLNFKSTPKYWTNINFFNISWTNPYDSSGICGFYYKLDSPPSSNDNGTYIPGNNITNYSGITVSGDGQHIIWIWLKDKEGKINFQENTFTSLYLDTTGPTNFQILDYMRIYYENNPTIICHFTVEGAGINISSIQFAYSNDGSITPTNWMNVDGVYLDEACTIEATNGATGEIYAKIEHVPFAYFSLTRNTIRFKASDISGNTQVQSVAVTIKTINIFDMNIIIFLIIALLIGTTITIGLIIFIKSLRSQNIQNTSIEKSSEIETSNTINIQKNNTPLNKVDEKYEKFPETIRKININKLVKEFQDLERSGKLEEALEKLDKILDISEEQDYQVLYKKLLQKYRELQRKILNI